MTPAEERAARDGLTVVLLIPFEARRVAAGNPLIVRTLDGSEVLVRLFTAEEFLDVQHAAAEEHDTEKISLARAAELVRPL